MFVFTFVGLIVVLLRLPIPPFFSLSFKISCVILIEGGFIIHTYPDAIIVRKTLMVILLIPADLLVFNFQILILLGSRRLQNAKIRQCFPGLLIVFKG